MANLQTDFHMAKGDGLFIGGSSLIAVCSLGLVSVLVAWALGGTEFKDSIFGNAAMIVFGTGIIAGAVMDYFAKKRGHGK